MVNAFLIFLQNRSEDMRSFTGMVEPVSTVARTKEIKLQTQEMAQRKTEILVSDDDAEIEAIGKGICAVVGGGVALVISVFLGSFICGIYYQAFPPIVFITVVSCTA